MEGIRFWLGYLVIVAAILFVGWEQPLRYRFMTRQEIHHTQHPVVQAAPSPAPTPPLGGTERSTSLESTGLERNQSRTRNPAGTERR